MPKANRLMRSSPVWPSIINTGEALSIPKRVIRPDPAVAGAPEICFTASMADAATIEQSGASGSKAEPVHPLYVRITHWINALAILIMIGSGWRIYNASPLFPFSFPERSHLAMGLPVAAGLPARFFGISPECGCSS